VDLACMDFELDDDELAAIESLSTSGGK
jgi:hypothetical protein